MLALCSLPLAPCPEEGGTNEGKVPPPPEGIGGLDLAERRARRKALKQGLEAPPGDGPPEVVPEVLGRSARAAVASPPALSPSVPILPAIQHTTILWQ